MTRNRFLISAGWTLGWAMAAWPQTADFVPVIAKQASQTVELPGEFQPFLSVSLHAKVAGFVERVLVDRGSAVNAGQLLVELSAPEMAAQIAKRVPKRRWPNRIACRRKRNWQPYKAPMND